jgi:hypothetical protein
MATVAQESRARGRKTRQESSSAEFRQRLGIWKQTPAAFRPSLRELARQMGTSHQLLGHYLIGLEVAERRENRIDSIRRTIAWFDQYLMGKRDTLDHN